MTIIARLVNFTNTTDKNKRLFYSFSNTISNILEMGVCHSFLREVLQHLLSI